MNSLVRHAALAGLAAAFVGVAGSQTIITFEGSGANIASITPTRDAFRAAVGGGTTAGANGSFGGLRREINWDGVPAAQADPNPFAANFFNVNSPRCSASRATSRPSARNGSSRPSTASPPT